MRDFAKAKARVDARQTIISTAPIPPPIKDAVDRELEEALERLRQRVAGMIERRKAAGEVETELTPEDRREKRWLALCPDDFQDTERARLPCPAEIIRRVMAHPIRRQSLRLIGPTGLGKTRLAWELLRPEFDQGATIAALDAGEFGSQASDAYRNGTEAEFFGKLMRPDILFLDDVGKGRMTQRIAEALFTIIDRRGNKRRPILLTQNYTFEALRQKLLRDEIDPETVEATLRRIEDRMLTIVVAK